MTTPTMSARLDELTERRVAETVKRRGITRSDWLREVIVKAIDTENRSADQALPIADMVKRFTVLEDDVRDIKESLCNLDNTSAIERAADRAVAQQVYRMAFRAAYLVVKQFTDEVPEEQRDDLGMGLCMESDDLCYDTGLARLDQVMRDAREELRQSIERANHGVNVDEDERPIL